MTIKFDLPIGWIKSKLIHAIEPRGEKALPSEYPDAQFLGMDHVEAQTTRIIGSVAASSMKSSAAKFYAGDVLYGRLRPYLNKVAQPTFSGLASAEFIVFPDTELLTSKFLRFRLNAADFVSFASHLNEGDRPRVSFDQIGEFEFLIPPPAEQHRIVAKIEALFSELDKGIESFKTAREQLKIYRQALLKHAFSGKLTEQWRVENADKLESAETLLQRIQTEHQQRYQQQLKDWEANGKSGSKPKAPKTLPPLTAEELAELPELPEGWLWIKSGELFESVTSGSRGWAEYYADSGAIFIRITNLDFDSLELDLAPNKIQYVQPPAGAEGLRTKVKEGDFLFSITGYLGMFAIAPLLENAYVNQHISLARPVDGFDKKYFGYYVTSHTGGIHFLNKQTKGAVKAGLGLEDIQMFPVPICSCSEQLEITERLESRLSEVDQLDQTITIALQQAEALRQSILKKAFSGQLVSQDPNDEPANVLLERIRAEKAQADIQPARRRGKTA